ncbi:hypothetical protein GGU11DRAFT_873728 [Lentinula aff. detonsa]|nr:hypothetical protein GGU11DRAFT_873728 [Lentinula aff. detonsa]
MSSVLNSSTYTCSGCQKRCNCISDFIQHLEKSTKSTCQAVHNDLKYQICQSHFLPHHNPPLDQSSTSKQHRRNPRDLKNNTLHPHSSNPEQQEYFEGDFFGNDYAGDDFPGFDPPESNVDDTNEEEDADADREENIGKDIEAVWEPHCSPVLLQPEEINSSSSNQLISEDERLPVPIIDPLLQRLPAHREDIHVEVFGGSFDPNDGFESYQSCLPGISENPWAPFASCIDWEVAWWAKMRGTGSTAFLELLAVDGLYESLGLSYRTSAELNCIIDNQLPAQRPSFSRQEVVVAGKAFDLFKQPILDCICSLYSSPNFAPYLCVSPERHYTDANKVNRLYHDMYTGKWWWSTQTQLEKDKPGATIVPVIIFSDKTQVTLFRNKSAYPVYLTIGNLPKEIPVLNLFHACMNDLLSPLKNAGKAGVAMESGDRIKRRCHPILAAYIGDYPEQMLVTCGYYGDNELGGYPCTTGFRDPTAAVEAVKSIGTSEWVENCLDANIKPVQHPFWEDLPYTDIFRAITSDILHQLYQGVMKHLIQWLKTIVGAEEIDAHVQRLPPNHGLQHFHKGITSLSWVSGTEHKQMCSFLLSLVVDIPNLSSSDSHRLLMATKSLLDFLDQSLVTIEASLAEFHKYKAIFIDLGAREHFNLPKLHFLCHYVRAFKLFGTSNNYNTKTTEPSNRKDEYFQMTKWLERHEKVGHHMSYINWKKSQAATSSHLPFSHDTHVPGVRYDFPSSQRSLDDMQCHLTQYLAKTGKLVLITKLEDSATLGYGAVKFESTLKRYIAQFGDPELRPGEVEDMASFLTLPFRSILVWHKLKFWHEQLFGKETLDVISANPRRCNLQGQVIQASRYSTALIRVEKDDGRGLQIGRICVIFSLPVKNLDCLFPVETPLPAHLAYVKWFSKFRQNPDPHNGLYHIKPLLWRDGSRAVSIVPLDTIQQSVHLYPKWGGTVPPEWTHESILDTCSLFFLSLFIDTHMYFRMQQKHDTRGKGINYYEKVVIIIGTLVVIIASSEGSWAKYDNNWLF